VFNRQRRARTKAELAIERLDDRVVPAVGRPFFGQFMHSFPAPFGFSANGQFVTANSNGALLRGGHRFARASFAQFGPMAPINTFAPQGNLFVNRPPGGFNPSNPFLTTPTPTSPVFPVAGGHFGGFTTPFGGAVTFQFPSSSAVNVLPGTTPTPTPTSPVFPVAGGNYSGFGVVALR